MATKQPRFLFQRTAWGPVIGLWAGGRIHAATLQWRQGVEPALRWGFGMREGQVYPYVFYLKAATRRWVQSGGKVCE